MKLVNLIFITLYDTRIHTIKKIHNFKYEKNNIVIRNKKIKNKTKKNKLEEIIMTYNKKIGFDDIKCKIYSQILTSSFVSR